MPLLRLQYQAFRYFSGGSSQNPLQINHGLYVATRCADGPFPWQQKAGTKERLAQAQSALGQIPAKAFYPFPASTAFQAGDLFRCATWPATTPPLAEQTPVVPTVVLSGELDLRTPNEDARKIADATLITIPNVGHSSLYADTSGCARQAVTAFIDNQQPNHARPHQQHRTAFSLPHVPHDRYQLLVVSKDVVPLGGVSLDDVCLHKTIMDSKEPLLYEYT